MSSSATRVILIRHAEPDTSTRGRCCGRLDVELSKLGKRQAELLAEHLTREQLAAVYTSPARRAIETATPIAAACALEPVPIDGFAEINFGRLEGRTYTEIAANEPELYRAWMKQPTTIQFPGGESFTDLRARALNDFARLRHRHHDAAFAIVAHGGVTRALLGQALAMPRHAIFRLDQAHACLNIIDWFETEPIVRIINHVLKEQL